MKQFIYFIILAVSIAGCDRSKEQTEKTTQSEQSEKKIKAPLFSGDAAYAFVAKQTEFGPRVPGSKAHADCADWMAETMNQYADTVIVQDFKMRAYTKNILNGKNIIAVFNPSAKKRILLASHWDSRPYGDHDPDPSKHREPIDGANDGASGVGVLMELGRLMHAFPIDANLGVDIVFFDLEDYGPHTEERTDGDDDFWALGSQYWSKNPHQIAYKAQFGILLDMVGAKGAIFPREYFSQQYAGWVLDKVWRTASDLGYSNIFVNKPGNPINDDHIYVNRIAGIPMIDIIHLDENSTNGTFFEYWHTAQDNIDHIDPVTLGIVGTVVTTVVYQNQ